MTVRSLIARSSSRRISIFCSPTESRGAWRRSSWAGSARSSSRSCAMYRSALWRLFAISTCAKRRRRSSRACTTASSGSSRTGPADRSGSGSAGQPLRCDRWRLRGDRRHRTDADQGVSLHAWRICWAIRNSSSRYRDGRYVTLRLTSSMYHRFHAPHDCHVEQVTYISGDTWNVNPIALKRVEKLFCKNERAVMRTRLTGTGHLVTLVPVAAVLVASIRLHFLDVLLHLRLSRAQCHCLRRDIPQRRGDGLVSARIDHHRLRAGWLHAVRKCARRRNNSGGGAMLGYHEKISERESVL